MGEFIDKQEIPNAKITSCCIYTISRSAPVNILIIAVTRNLGRFNGRSLFQYSVNLCFESILDECCALTELNFSNSIFVAKVDFACTSHEQSIQLRRSNVQ